MYINNGAVITALLLLVTTGASADAATRAEAPAGPVLGHYRNHPGGGSWLDNMTEAEKRYGPFAGHWRSYHPPGRLPMDPRNQLGEDEITAAGLGKRLHISWRPWPEGGNWASPYDDRTLAEALTRLKNHCGSECWLSLAPEPELDWNGAEGPIPGFGFADFRAMWSKVAAARTSAGADNVKLAWVVQGSDQWQHLYHELWPGNDLVDVVGQDPYIRKFHDAEELGRRMVAQTRWFRNHTDPTTDYAGKPHVIAEYGCDLGGDEADRGTVAHRAACIDGVRAVLDELADIDDITVAELSFFDSNSNAINDPPQRDGNAYQNLKNATER